MIINYINLNYPYLISLLRCVHIDYVEQFLNDTETHQLRLTKLEVDHVQLKLVTKNCTRASTRLNCISENKLNICETMVNSKVFFVYFPLLKTCFLY
jgi:hypothetical protein